MLQQNIYNSDGSKDSVVYGSGVKEEFKYNKDNTLRTLTNKNSAGTVLNSYSYEYDAANKQIKKTDSKGVTNYYYDSLNRLAKVVEPSGKVVEYTFDADGNRLSERSIQSSIETVTLYQYNEQNRLITTEKTVNSGSKEITEYVYDHNGNMTMKSTESTKKIDLASPPKPTFGIIVIGQPNTNPKLDNIVKGFAAFEYDEWNQMVKSVTAEGTTIHKYNADGLRVEKIANDASTKYLYEGDKVVLETDGTGKEVARNIQGVSLTARKVDGQTVNYLYNGHGDVKSIINTAGVKLATYYYDAFGNPTETTGNISNPYIYAGYQYDKETGLYYLNARMYDSNTARFLQEDTYRGDPTNVLSLNLYTYCNNEPIMYADPTGHAAVDVDGNTKYSAIQAEKKKAEAKKKAAKDKLLSPSAAMNSTKKSDEVKKSNHVIVQGTWNPTSTGFMEAEAKISTKQSDSVKPSKYDWDAMISPGSLTGTVSSATGTLATLGAEYLPKEILSSTMPKNIAIGTAKKMLETEAAETAADMAKIAKGADVVGYVAIGIDVGYGVHINRQEGASTSKTVSDAVVDASFGIGGLLVSAASAAAATAATSAIAGSIAPGPGNIIGAVGGFIGGFAYSLATEVWLIDGKSIKDRAKETLTHEGTFRLPEYNSGRGYQGYMNSYKIK